MCITYGYRHGQGLVDLRGVYSDTTQLNSTSSSVELSWRSVYSDTTQLNSTQLSPINERSDPVDLVCRSYVINKNTTDLAVRCSTGSVELS